MKDFDRDFSIGDPGYLAKCLEIVKNQGDNVGFSNKEIRALRNGGNLPSIDELTSRFSRTSLDTETMENLYLAAGYPPSIDPQPIDEITLLKAVRELGKGPKLSRLQVIRAYLGF
jgi:hypothetical protein